MSRFTTQSIERVRDAVDFAEVVSAYTDLRRAGRRLLGLCPFHEERTPSFSVDPGEKLYYCFGCEAHGDVFTFLEEKEGIGFTEAIEVLAERFGVELERESEDPRAEEVRKRRNRLGEALSRAASFYENALWVTDEAKRARSYLDERGLTESTLRKFGAGYAPSAWDTLIKRSRMAGFKDAEMLDAGLAQKGQKGGVYDRFRGRIVFPIRDARGRTQGFGARALRGDQKPKYVNSPEGVMYQKKRTLYGLDLARSAIIKKSSAVVVEGYFDVLALHQAGVEETVAISGTAFTPEQIQILAAMCDEVVLALDADRAGREAMLRTQQLVKGKRLRLRVAAMPVGKDPADLLAGHGPASDAAAGFRQLIEKAEDLPVYHVHTLLDEADLSSPTGRDRSLDEILPVLAGMGDSITREELTAEVADRLKTDPGLVSRRLSQTAGRSPGAISRSGDTGGGFRSADAAADGRGESRGAGGGAPSKPVALNEHEQREMALLAMCIASPTEGREFLDRLSDDLLSSPILMRVRDWLVGNLDHPTQGLSRDDAELLSIVTKLVMASGREPATRESMQINYMHLEKAALERRLAVASGAGEEDRRELDRQLAEIKERIARW